MMNIQQVMVRAMKKTAVILSIVILVTACGKNERYKFEYAEPEAKGFSSTKLDILRTHLEKAGSSSMILMVDGKIIFEWGSTAKRHVIHSMRKCLLNSLYGIAVADGSIDTSMTLKELGIEDIEPGLSENELNARIADLLKSRSGVYHHAAGVHKSMLIGMPVRDTFLPGEHYYYNNWDFNTLGAILEERTGRSLYELFEDQIAKPLGMHHYKGRYTSIDGEAEGVDMPETDGFYQYEESKSQYPAYHFRMSALDLALYGQLYMNKGAWKGEQLIPEDWIEASTYPYSLNNTDQGIAYGMLWYVLTPNEYRGKSFYHSGLGIHMLGVYPGMKMVLVHRVDTENDFTFNKGDFYKMLGLVFESTSN